MQSDANDREARLFAAVTRVLASALTNGPGSAGLTTMRDLLESFGLTRNSNDSMMAGPPFAATPDLNGRYNPPATIPNLSQLTDYLAGPLVTLLDAATADLDAIINSTTVANPFVVTLTAAETGDLPVEIDLGDVLTLKAMFCALKAQALMLHAWEMDNVDLRQMFILGNADILQLQRDLLDKYQQWMKLNTNATATMTQAKSALLLAITTSQAAYDAITGETDDQTDDLLTFADQQAMDEAKGAIAMLTEVKASIDENRPAILGEEEWTWWSTDGMQHHLSLRRDSSGTIVGGSTDFGWEIDPVSSQISSDAFTIKASQTVSCVGTWQLTGTVANTTITAIDSTVSGCAGQLANETFTGGKGYINADAGSKFDFTVLFGKNGQAPLEVRAYLPEFWADGSPMAGSITDPTYGGLWPYMTMEDNDFTATIPVATITLDGSAADWNGIATLGTGGLSGSYPSPNSDIETISVARDTTYLYWLLQTAAPPPPQSITFQVTVSPQMEVSPLTALVTLDGSGTKSYTLTTFDAIGGQMVSGTATDVAMGSVIEGRIPLAQLAGFTALDISASSWQAEPPYSTDFWESNNALMLPTTTLSGSIQYTPQVTGVDVGQTLIAAYNGPDPNTASLLGSAVVDGVGAYTIPELPSGKPIYLVALGDTDMNGIQTLIDYAGTGGPVTPQATGATQNIPIAQPTPAETTFSTPIVPGWNLLSSTVGFKVATTVGNNTVFKSVWKWENNTWAVYLPGGDQGKAYAQAKGFGFLATINPGEGFWVNSSITMTSSATGTPVYGPMGLSNGWNLIGLKTEYPTTAASICASQSGVTSLWKWENGTWSVFLPGEELPGAYVASKNYHALTTIAPGEGFWVNKK